MPPTTHGSLRSIRPGERVLVTGGTGSLGHALTDALLASHAVVRVYSRDEKKQYDMGKLFPDVEYVLGDIRCGESVRDAVRDVDVVIHGASLKYVNIGELQPLEYVRTNVDGTLHLLDAVLAEGSVRRCVAISSDKACLPVNTYGMTKAILEKLCLEGARRRGSKIKTVFNVARYGNVVGTRGSVIPFWAEQIEQGLPLPVTDPDMTRFFFTMAEAVELIDMALVLPEATVTSKRMRSCTVGDLAAAMRSDLPDGASPVEVVGPRPGERRHEMLLSSDEMARTRVVGDFFVFTPGSDPTPGAFDSFDSFGAERLSPQDLAALL